MIDKLLGFSIQAVTFLSAAEQVNKLAGCASHQLKASGSLL